MFPITMTVTLHNDAELVQFVNALPKPATEAAPAKNSPSSRATPARTEPTASGAVDAAQGKTADASDQSAGNAAAEPQASTAAIDFETLKKAFLALSNTGDGRTKCETVLKSVEPALPKLSAAKPEQYADLLAAIKKQEG